MDATASTKDQTAKIDGNERFVIVETLAPERYREAHIPGELAAMGYTNVAHYPEGRQGWMVARLPVAKGAYSGG